MLQKVKKAAMKGVRFDIGISVDLKFEKTKDKCLGAETMRRYN